MDKQYIEMDLKELMELYEYVSKLDLIFILKMYMDIIKDLEFENWSLSRKADQYRLETINGRPIR